MNIASATLSPIERDLFSSELLSERFVMWAECKEVRENGKATIPREQIYPLRTYRFPPNRGWVFAISSYTGITRDILEGGIGLGCIRKKKFHLAQ
jgi:hypothetical protein